MSAPLQRLTNQIRACRICAAHFPHPPRPVFQLGSAARILIAGQAPGSKVQQSGIPFDDPSGDRLRDWLGVPREVFYDPGRIAILPIGFCYPGRTRHGDLPPRPECAATWRRQVLALLPNIELTLLLGRHAVAWHLNETAASNLTATIRAWQEHAPMRFPLPHPSPRNNRWLKRNPWFDAEVLPQLRARVSGLIRIETIRDAGTC